MDKGTAVFSFYRWECAVLAANAQEVKQFLKLVKFHNQDTDALLAKINNYFYCLKIKQAELEKLGFPAFFNINYLEFGCNEILISSY
jgi:hypothetical protein